MRIGKKRICFVTGTRADYGIMAPVMHIISESENAELQIIATNMHLSGRHGMTVKEIENDGFHVNYKIASLDDEDTPAAIVSSMAKVEEGLSTAFEVLKPDMVVLLGDRYEALAAASAAVVFGIPIVHLHGGETTEGAMDDMFRHAITKLSTYHFAATPEYAERIVSMGEKPENVFHSGAPGADFKIEAGSEIEGEFEKKTGLSPSDKFILLTMHPATLSQDGGAGDIPETIAALQEFIEKDYKILVTMPNSDPGNRVIRNYFLEWEEREKDKVRCVQSLGARLFHYALSRASVMVGNSSAALIEAPSVRLPAVNIGIRQKGRTAGPTVIHVPGERLLIREAVNRALSPEFRNQLMSLPLQTINPYYRKDAAAFIAKVIRDEGLGMRDEG